MSVAGALPAPPERAWQALVDGGERRQWWPQLRRLDAQPGGRFEERWSDGDREVLTAGTVDEAVAPRRLRLTWADEDWPAPTRVTIELSREGPGTRASVRHEGWEALPGGAALARAHERGWRAHLERWARHLDARASAAPL